MDIIYTNKSRLRLDLSSNLKRKSIVTQYQGQPEIVNITYQITSQAFNHESCLSRRIGLVYFYEHAQNIKA